MLEWLYRDVDVVAAWNGGGPVFAAWFMAACTLVNFGFAFMRMQRSKLVSLVAGVVTSACISQRYALRQWLSNYNWGSNDGYWSMILFDNHFDTILDPGQYGVDVPHQIGLRDV